MSLAIFLFQERAVLRIHSACRLKMAVNVAYMLQEPLKEEPETMQRQHIIVPLSINGTFEWCTSFVLVPKVNNKIRICLGPARFNKVLIRPVHRG